MAKLTPTQVNALRLASEVPSCLGVGMYYRPTERRLEKMGLIYTEGRWASGDGAMAPKWIITDAGKKALAESSR